MSIIPKVQDILQENLKLDFASLTPDATFSDLGADSLDMVNIVLDCEDEFSIDIPDKAVAEFRTILDLTTYITNTLIAQ